MLFSKSARELPLKRDSTSSVFWSPKGAPILPGAYLVGDPGDPRHHLLERGALADEDVVRAGREEDLGVVVVGRVPRGAEAVGVVGEDSGGGGEVRELARVEFGHGPGARFAEEEVFERVEALEVVFEPADVAGRQRVLAREHGLEVGDVDGPAIERRVEAFGVDGAEEEALGHLPRGARRPPLRLRRRERRGGRVGFEGGRGVGERRRFGGEVRVGGRDHVEGDVFEDGPRLDVSVDDRVGGGVAAGEGEGDEESGKEGDAHERK